MDELHDSDAQASPVWAIFSDLMAALVGILVLLLVWVIGIQLELSQSWSRKKPNAWPKNSAAWPGRSPGRPVGQRPGDFPQWPHRHQRQRAVPAQL